MVILIQSGHPGLRVMTGIKKKKKSTFLKVQMLEVPKQQNCSKKDFLNGIDHLENPATEVTHHEDEDILYGLPLTC